MTNTIQSRDTAGYPSTVIDLRIVQSVKPDISSNLDVMSFPLSGPEETIVDSYEGTVRKFVITGVIAWVGATEAEIMDVVVALENTQDGAQLYTLQLHLDKYDTATGHTGIFNVKVEKFLPELNTAAVLRVPYTLHLIQAGG